MSQHPTFKYVFLGIDFTLITLAYFLALSVCVPQFWFFDEVPLYFYISHLSMYLIVLSVFLFSMRYNNLYKRHIVILRYRQFVLILKSLFAAVLIITIAMVFFNMEYFAVVGKQQVLYFGGISFLLVAFLRAAFAHKVYEFIARKKISRINVLIVGGDKAGSTAADSMMKDDFADFRIAGFLDDYRPKGVIFYQNYKNLGRLEDLDAVIEEHVVDEILVAIDHAPYARLIKIVETCIATGKPVRIFPNLFNVIAEKLDVEQYAAIPLVAIPTKPVHRTVFCISG